MAEALRAGSALLLSILREPDPTFTVFGPRSYLRETGRPARVQERVIIPRTAAAPFDLRVEGGAGDGGWSHSACPL